MKLLRRLAVVLVVLIGLRIVIPLGTSWAHYRSTPGFREWVSEQPVGDDVWRAAVPTGEELSRGVPWSSHDDPQGERSGRWTPAISVHHGDELLMELELGVSYASREVEGGNEAFEGLAVSVTRSQLDPDFHGIAVLSVEGLSGYADGVPGTGRAEGPRVQLDAFALAGPGPLEVLVQEVAALDAAPPPLSGSFGDGYLTAWRYLTGIPYSNGRPPEEGLAYQARTTFTPTWSSTTTGAVTQWHFAGNSQQYSAKLAGEQSVKSPLNEQASFSISAHRDVHFTWQGEVW
jgi:hypothetical protein